MPIYTFTHLTAELLQSNDTNWNVWKKLDMGPWAVLVFHVRWFSPPLFPRGGGALFGEQRGSPTARVESEQPGPTQFGTGERLDDPNGFNRVRPVSRGFGPVSTRVRVASLTMMR